MAVGDFEQTEELRVAEVTSQHHQGPGSSPSNAFESFTPLAGAPSVDFQVMQHEGAPTGFALEANDERSAIVRADRLTTFYTRLGFTVPAAFSSQLIFGNYDLIFEALYGRRWSPAVSVTASDVTITAGSPGYVLTSATPGAFSTLAADLPCPMWLTIGDGVVGPTLDTMVIVQGIDGAGTVLTVGGGTTAVLDDFGPDVTLGLIRAPGDALTIAHDGVLHFGTPCFFLQLEVAQLGVDHYHNVFGALVTSFTQTLATDSVLTIGFDFMGKGQESPTATLGTGSELQPATGAGFKPFETGNQVRFFGIRNRFSTGLDPTVTIVDLTPTTFDWTTSVEPIPVPAVGSTGPFAHLRQDFIETGNITLLTNDDSLAIANLAGGGGVFSTFHANIQQITPTTFNGMAWWRPEVKPPMAAHTFGANQAAALRPITVNNQLDSRSHLVGVTQQGGHMGKVVRFGAQPNN